MVQRAATVWVGTGFARPDVRRQENWPPAPWLASQICTDCRPRRHGSVPGQGTARGFRDDPAFKVDLRVIW